MGHDTPRLEIERRFEEATAGLNPGDTELVRQELELYLCELLGSEIASGNAPEQEDTVSSEELVDYLATLDPFRREDLWRAVNAKSESLRQGLSVFEKIRRLEDFSLTAWIQSASRGLCDDAKARIAKEIEAHYADAFGEARGHGLPEPVAHVEAMESLGDSHSARRAFRKTYLTEPEDQLLRSLLRDPNRPGKGSPRFIYLFCLVPQMLAAVIRISSKDGNVYIAAALFLLSILVGVGAAALLSPRLLRAKRFTAGLAVFLAGTAAIFLAITLFLAYSWAIDLSVPTKATFIFASILLFWGFLALRVLPMIRKLRRNT